MNEKSLLSTCVLCGKKYTGIGNSCYPIFDDDSLLCCDDCNDTRVIAARLKLCGKK